MSELITKIDKTVAKHQMLQDGDFVVIGVSGGADSMLLLQYLAERHAQWHLRLLVANVEHGIRGEASREDSRFVASFCQERGIPFECLTINAPEEAKAKGMGLEEYAREARYAFFRSFNPDKIATAHHLSDNVETVLFRLSRGTSLKGCCGIPPVRGNIVRPLIDCTADEIRQECAALSVPYVVDETNADNAYSRNYIRNVIVPAFEKLNPSFESVFARFIETANTEEAYLQKEADACFDACFEKDYLRLDKLRKYDEAIIKRTIVRFMSLFDVTLDDLHLNGVFELVNRPGRCQIKRNLFAISDKKRLRTAVFEEQIDFSSLVVDKKITSREDFLANRNNYQKQFAFYCDYDKIIGCLSLRAREAGDEISPAGRDCTKSLKKLYNEYAIPVEDRENIPLVCDEKGIIGVCGYCCDERVKIDNTTSSVMLLNIRTEDTFE